MDVSDARKLKGLEEENAKLKKLLAEQMLDVATLKEMLEKTSDAWIAACSRDLGSYTAAVPIPVGQRSHQELKRKHVTLTIVWDGYIAREPDGNRYSRFRELYRSWEARLSVTKRQLQRAGEKLFVDHAVDTVPVVVDRLTGQKRDAKILSPCWERRASFMPAGTRVVEADGNPSGRIHRVV